MIKDLKQYLQNEAWPKLLFDNLETAIRNAIEIGSKGESYCQKVVFVLVFVPFIVI